jgi:hypothetical protein
VGKRLSCPKLYSGGCNQGVLFACRGAAINGDTHILTRADGLFLRHPGMWIGAAAIAHSGPAHRIPTESTAIKIIQHTDKKYISSPLWLFSE